MLMLWLNVTTFISSKKINWLEQEFIILSLYYELLVKMNEQRIGHGAQQVLRSE